MSAHVLLNLFNELRKRDKIRGSPSILSLFCNEFNAEHFISFATSLINSIIQQLNARF